MYSEDHTQRIGIKLDQYIQYWNPKKFTDPYYEELRKIQDPQRYTDRACAPKGGRCTAVAGFLLWPVGILIDPTYGPDAAFISVGSYHHHIGLNMWFSRNAPPAALNAVGLFHTAIVYPNRKDLAVILQRLRSARYPLSGASDHGVSEALYLYDPDGNGVELYYDRPRELWPHKPDGSIEMFTLPLDLQNLLEELEKQ